MDEAHKIGQLFGNKLNKTSGSCSADTGFQIFGHLPVDDGHRTTARERTSSFHVAAGRRPLHGKFRTAHKVDVADLMRRMVKEDLLKFRRHALFPKRRAYTAN